MSAERGSPDPLVHPPMRRSDIAATVGIVVMIVLIAVLEYTTAGSAGKMSVQTQQTLLLLYRRLYYIPIIYAAFVFGKRGGLSAGIVVSVLFSVNQVEMFSANAPWVCASTTRSRSSPTSRSDCSSAPSETPRRPRPATSLR